MPKVTPWPTPRVNRQAPSPHELIPTASQPRAAEAEVASRNSAAVPQNQSIAIVRIDKDRPCDPFEHPSTSCSPRAGASLPGGPRSTRRQRPCSVLSSDFIFIGCRNLHLLHFLFSNKAIVFLPPILFLLDCALPFFSFGIANAMYCKYKQAQADVGTPACQSRRWTPPCGTQHA